MRMNDRALRRTPASGRIGPRASLGAVFSAVLEAEHFFSIATARGRTVESLGWSPLPPRAHVNSENIRQAYADHEAS